MVADLQSVGDIVFVLMESNRNLRFIGVPLGVGDVRAEWKCCREGPYADGIRIHPDIRARLTTPSHVEGMANRPRHHWPSLASRGWRNVEKRPTLTIFFYGSGRPPLLPNIVCFPSSNVFFNVFSP